MHLGWWCAGVEGADWDRETRELALDGDGPERGGRIDLYEKSLSSGSGERVGRQSKGELQVSGKVGDDGRLAGYLAFHLHHGI